MRPARITTTALALGCALLAGCSSKATPPVVATTHAGAPSSGTGSTGSDGVASGGGDAGRTYKVRADTNTMQVTFVKLVDPDTALTATLPIAGRHYASVEFTIVNLGPELVHGQGTLDLNLLDAQGNEYTPADTTNDVPGNREQLHLYATWPVGSTKTGWIVCTVPDGDKVTKVHFFGSPADATGADATWSVD